ncbi:CPBP family intramembrane glutamic endopeptidase [Massilia soli]|uniref:CPBP family intramembrane metalloprotease n=1 Tax=Massilia soli TaxID=2792854 RepID=A0ABS7STC6_9BURK|nr:CPBP family intramembrane glutamic endopeptidase [Massilia soli]MBZ2209190.1 CPBP family intramembrane metalloprotease [Massilia soli]
MPELILAAYLVAVMPARSIWKSLNKQATATRAPRYLKTIVEIAILLAMLAAVTMFAGRSADSLGLDWPLSRAGFWGLVGALILLAVLWLAGAMSSRSLTDDKRAELESQVMDSDAMPRTAAELRMFFVASLFVGTGWELLYRGFLLAVLTPLIGAFPAIAAAAIAYGLAHGYKSPQQLISSIISAFIFTIAYYLTQSLWWLMLIHTGIGIIGALGAYKAVSSTREPTPAS